MNQLLPIIRRARRPLLPVEPVPDGPTSPVVVGDPELIKADVAAPTSPTRGHFDQGEPDGSSDCISATPSPTDVPTIHSP